MLVLTFQVGENRLGLDIRRVREVVPRVALQKPASGPDWLAGLFIHRGRAVPVIDLHLLLGEGECPAHLSSRIILVPMGETGLLGLLATQVADLREVRSDAVSVVGLSAPGRPDLGPAIVEDGGILRLLDLDRLLPAPARALLEGAGS